jgi:Raf kinase inhibitor-like YbhB/YbcL family protein
MIRSMRRLLAVVTIVLVVATAACGDDKPAATTTTTTTTTTTPGGITVTSTGFNEGERIPEKFSCQGDNVPPPLSWSGVPAGTTTVALMLTDPDAPRGVFVHWIVTGLPASSTGSLADGTSLPSGARTEVNSTDQAVYTGMCPPSGATHRYIFEVVALGQTVTFPAGATPQDKVRLLREAASDHGQLTGTFKG